MKYVRILLGVLVGLYALMGLYQLGMTVGHKTGLVTVSGDAARMIPLMQATAWWQAAVWLASLVLLLAAAWRLLGRGKALGLYLAGFVLNVGGWLTVQRTEAYQQVFSPAERQLDYYLLGVMVVIGLLIWLTERSRAPRAAAA